MKPAEDQYCPVKFPLAIECEWGDSRDIKYDFQKLLFCNAQLRLLIFRIDAEQAERSMPRSCIPILFKALKAMEPMKQGQRSFSQLF
jgi:hypothetical protein